MKKILKTLFCDSDGNYSWRKGLTGITVLMYMVAVIGYLIKHKFGELPSSYIGLIGVVFTFYFFKSTIENIKK